jgi:hypothetical protein
MHIRVQALRVETAFMSFSFQETCSALLETPMRNEGVNTSGQVAPVTRTHHSTGT